MFVFIIVLHAHCAVYFHCLHVRLLRVTVLH